MKKYVPEALYNLIPSQLAMYMMVKYSFSKQLVQIPTSFTVDKDMDFDILTKALNIEFERNDALRLRFVKKDKEIKQYFLPSFKMNKVPCKYFRSAEQQNEFLSADAQKPIRFLKDECFRIYFYKTADGNNGIYINITHLSMDALGVMIFYLDLIHVYRHLRYGTEMPEPLFSYEDYIKEEFARLGNEKKMKKHAEFYTDYFKKNGEPFYCGVHGPALLEKTRKKQKNPNLRVPPVYNPLHDKCNMINGHIGAEDAEKIFGFCRENSIAPESLFLLGIRCHVSAINYRNKDVFMMVNCSKRATVKEKRMSGCVTHPLQVRTIIEEDASFRDALNEFTRVRTQLYRHAEFPYVKALMMSREIYGYNQMQGPACMMFSWIPIPYDLGNEQVKFDFRTYDLGRYFTPLYAICSPDPKDKGINLNYMYRVKNSQKEQIQALHYNAVKVILAGIENPDIKIGTLLDMCLE